MPTIFEQWLYAVPLAIIAFYACRFRWWLGLGALAWPILLIKGGWTLYIYDFVGESLLYDNSRAYFGSILLSASLVVFAVVFGIWGGSNGVRQGSHQIS